MVSGEAVEDDVVEDGLVSTSCWTDVVGKGGAAAVLDEVVIGTDEGSGGSASGVGESVESSQAVIQPS